MDRGAIYRVTSVKYPGDTTVGQAEVQEIWRIVSQGGSRCADAVSFMGYRLTKWDPLIKLKTIKLVHNLLQAPGTYDFKRQVKRQLLDKLRALTALRNPSMKPDFELDDRYKQIRVAAEQCLSALFAEENNVTGSGTSGTEGFPKMEGFGSERYTPSYRRDNSSSGGGGFFGASQLVNGVWRSFYGSDKGLGRLSHEVSSLSTQAYNPNAGPIGGGSYYNPNSAYSNYDQTPTSIGVGGGSGPIAPMPNLRRGVPGDITSRSAGNGEYEASIVSRIVEVRGARVAPTQGELDKFVGDCAVCDLPGVWVALFCHIDDERASWQRRFRALTVLDALLSTDRMLDAGETIGDATRNFCVTKGTLDGVRACLLVQPCARMAREVLKTCNVPIEPPSTAPTATSIQPAKRAPAKKTDLLDQSDEENPADNEEDASLGATQASPARKDEDLLGMMSSDDEDTRKSGKSGPSASVQTSGPRGGDLLEL